MSSIWNSAAAPAGNSPFATAGVGPKPGGGAVARFQSLLSSGQSGQSGSPGQIGLSGQATQPASQLGLSPKSGMTASAKVAAVAANSSSSSSDSGASITANDFLTLLVTEMQNQDPTAQTDPNAYVDQLVQINSLEQLISMNQNLALVLGTVTSPVPGVGSGIGPAASSAVTGVAGATPGSPIASAGMASTSSGRPSVPLTGVQQVAQPGNIAAASRSVAHALDGHIPVAWRGHAIRDIPTH